MEFILIPAVIAIVILIIVVTNFRTKKAIDFYIRHSYGDKKRVKDDVNDRMEAVSQLYEKEKKNAFILINAFICYNIKNKII